MVEQNNGGVPADAGGALNGSAGENISRASMQHDTFKSFLAGFGVPGRDKSISMRPVITPLSPMELHALYRADWLSRKIVDVPPSDATRAWRSWNAGKKDVKKIEELERSLGLQRKIELAMCRARLLGGSALILGTADGAFDSILDYDKIGKGDLKFVHVVGRYNIVAGPLIKDVTSPWYGEPTHYLRTNNVSTGTWEQELKPPPQTSALGKQPGEMFIIHPSRVIRFIGHEYPDMEMAPDSWGDSVLQTIYDAIRDAGMTASSIAQIVAEAKLDIIKVYGLSETLSTQEGSKKLTERFMYTNAAKSTVNAVLIDKEEEWQCRQLNTGSLDRLLGMYFMLACGAADIPATRVLGKSPDGQNSTGDSDLRNYYDRLSSDQNVKMRPLLTRLDEVLIRSALGKRPEDIDYEWNPLWQASDAEKADIAYKKAQTFMSDVQSGMIPMTALATARTNQLIEDDFYPGLEQAIEDAEAEGDTLMEPKLPTPQGGPQGGFGAPGGGTPGMGQEGSPGGPQGQQEGSSGGSQGGGSGSPPFGGGRNPFKQDSEDVEVLPPFSDMLRRMHDAAWEESAHPRAGRGQHSGGQFVGKGGAKPAYGSKRPDGEEVHRTPTYIHSPEEERLIEDVCKAVAAKEGFTGKLTFRTDEYKFMVGNIRCDAAGLAHLDTGEIEIFPSRILDSVAARGIMAHEVQHQKFARVVDAYEEEKLQIHTRYFRGDDILKPDDTLRPEYADKFPLYAKLSKFFSGAGGEISVNDYIEGDGVTEYSYLYWKAFKLGKVEFASAVHETLAEMARLKSDGVDYPEFMGPRIISYREGGLEKPYSKQEQDRMSKVWRDFFAAVNATYKTLKKGA